MVKDKDSLEMSLNIIENICEELDFLSDAAIEERMVCDFECCIGNGWNRYILEDPSQEIQDFLGDKGVKLLQEYEKKLDELMYYDAEKGFSKTEPWLEFVSFINEVNLFLKDILRKHGRL
jgi:hypothetical protein